ncbi:hypothetical protein C8Q74DRAFT_1456384, partial [Fomes fomentarius]
METLGGSEDEAYNRVIENAKSLVSKFYVTSPSRKSPHHLAFSSCIISVLSRVPPPLSCIISPRSLTVHLIPHSNSLRIAWKTSLDGLYDFDVESTVVVVYLYTYGVSLAVALLSVVPTPSRSLSLCTLYDTLLDECYRSVIDV